MNYFELFELPVQVINDPQLLSQRYIALQKKYHPDFFTQEDAASQEDALEKSSEVNKAFKVLKDPDSSLFYLLQLKGVAVPGEKFELPPDFLMEVMELNENLSGGDFSAVESFGKAIYQEVQPMLENYNDSTVTAPELQQLKLYYYKKKYLQRILDRTTG